MRHPILVTGLLCAVLVCALQERGEADGDRLPTPRRLYDDDGDGFSAADFEQTLLKLRAERESLNADWQAVRKRKSAPEATIDMEQKQFQLQMQKALEDLKRRRQNSPPQVSASPGPETPQKKPEPETELKKPPQTLETKEEKAPAAVDAFALAHSLMRSKQYEEALTVFQQIDLKGKKAPERAPVQYLKACCMLHLGKTKEAAEVLQDVANYRGDEKLAGYAQWHLEQLRWQRDVAQKVQDIRQRRQALEKSQ